METLTLTLAPASSASHSDHRNMFITLLLYKGAAGPVAAAAARCRRTPGTEAAAAAVDRAVGWMGCQAASEAEAAAGPGVKMQI